MRRRSVVQCSLAGRPGRIARAGLIAAAIVPTGAPASAEDSREALAQRFKQYLASVPYSSFLADKVLAYDAAMPPPCKTRKITGDRRLFSVRQIPAFVDSRKVPVAGRWAERVEVERCGRKVRHNVYLTASKRRGLHAVVGFPGHSLAGLELQLRAGRAVLRQARGASPGCKRYDIVETRIVRRPAERTAPWTETWTAWICGKRITKQIRFAPQGAHVSFEVR